MAKRTGEKYMAILEGAIRVFARSGFHGTRVSEIAREAGVADGTVYIYFSNKEDILVSMFQELMARFVEGMREELRKASDARGKLRAIIHYHLSTLGAQPDRAMVTQIELRQIDEEINRGISGPLLSYFRLIEEVIEEGRKTGTFRTDINVRTARKVIFGAVDEVVTCWVMSQKRYHLADMAEPVYDLLLRGMVKEQSEARSRKPEVGSRKSEQ